jgi:hypothetical protein
LIRYLLTAAIAIPLMAAFPLAAIALAGTPEGRQVIFWVFPWSAGFWVMIYTTLSGVPWREGGDAVRRHREAHGGLLVASAKATAWLFGTIFVSYAVEVALLFAWAWRHRG